MLRVYHVGLLFCGHMVLSISIVIGVVVRSVDVDWSGCCGTGDTFEIQATDAWIDALGQHAKHAST